MPKFVKYGFLFLLLSVFGISGKLKAQQHDSIRYNTDFITSKLENLSRQTKFPVDYSDLTDDFIYYTAHPIDINSPKVKKLLELHLLNEMQLSALENYIHQYGWIYSLYELRYINGFTPRIIRQISPFIKTGKPEKTDLFHWKNIFRFGNQSLILRYGQLLEKSTGFRLPPDSAIQHPGTDYLGSPQHLYFRYAFRSSDFVRMGITLDKDAGEILTPHRLNDSIKTLLGNHLSGFPDFFSAFVYIAHWGIIQKAIVGDYHLEFGQGLALWSGITFGKSAETTQIKYYGNGIRPNTASNENRFLRGAAITLGKKNFALTLFYSWHKIDGTLFVSPFSQQKEISAFPESGLHRTINELLHKNEVTLSATGGHFSYYGRNWQTGATYYQTRLNLPLEPDSQLYRLYNFRGKTFSNASFDFSWQVNRFSLFGELASNPGKALAGTAGFNFYPDDRLSFVLSYRYFAPGYQVIYASPFMESSHPHNETGIYMGVKMLLSSVFSLSAYADYYRFPWLRFQINTPSNGKAFLIQLDASATARLNMNLRFRYGSRQENLISPDLYTVPVVTKELHDIRYELYYNPVPLIALKTRVEYLFYQKANDRQQGFLMLQDLAFHFQKIPLSVKMRYALFDTDGWNSRIYAYEDDVLYAFCVPAYYNKGQRIYLLLHYQWHSLLHFWLKIGRTTFFNQNHISSGADLIPAPHKTTLRFQIMAKF